MSTRPRRVCSQNLLSSAFLSRIMLSAIYSKFYIRQRRVSSGFLLLVASNGPSLRCHLSSITSFHSFSSSLIMFLDIFLCNIDLWTSCHLPSSQVPTLYSIWCCIIRQCCFFVLPASVAFFGGIFTVEPTASSLLSMSIL